jgi:hypothetical protein
VTPLTRRATLVAVFAAALLLVLSIAALAATNTWWFADSPTLPPSQSPAAVIATFTRDNAPWEFRAYKTAGGLCFGVAPATASDRGAVVCASSAPAVHALGGYVVSDDGNGDPWLAGVASDVVEIVEIQLSNGETLSAETMAAPPALADSRRFYLLKLPQPGVRVERIIARDAGGTPVDTLSGGS